MGIVLAQTTRGGDVESVHHGVVVVADAAGQVVAHAGDPERFAFFRSSAKPFQAVPVIESGAADRFNLTPAELALCCASHNAEPRQQQEVAALLAKVGLGPETLRCGTPPPFDDDEWARVALGLVPRSPLHSDCSGKHAGLLTVCVHLGYPVETYLDPDHPLQQTILGIVAEVLRLPAADIRPGIDGCGLPTFGAPLRTFAASYAALAAPAATPAGHGREHAAALDRLRAAMLTHPENVGGNGNLVTDLMAVCGGRIAAKSGAEGLLCLAVPDRGWGVAIRILDGSFRAHAVAAAAVLDQLDLVEPDVIAALLVRHDPTIRTHAGRPVGELRASFQLEA